MRTFNDATTLFLTFVLQKKKVWNGVEISVILVEYLAFNNHVIIFLDLKLDVCNCIRCKMEIWKKGKNRYKKLLYFNCVDFMWNHILIYQNAIVYIRN